MGNGEGAYRGEQYLGQSLEVTNRTQGFLRAPVLARDDEGGGMVSGRIEQTWHGGDRVGSVGDSGEYSYVTANKDAVRHRSHV
ncbi:hypothetical protein N7494_000599 [Penicillium frequentans]|uniref:Uncharacterized protein n=1 Tax=Penicillium frequentans TaxID=3151616 RepID=A0AAD6GJ47_9EURO|nr:hypothetical protein N7494_000599 [Penicillium glabrum]